MFFVIIVIIVIVVVFIAIVIVIIVIIIIIIVIVIIINLIIHHSVVCESVVQNLPKGDSLPMFEIALHSIVACYLYVGINNIEACYGVASVSSVKPIASGKHPFDYHDRTPPKNKIRTAWQNFVVIDYYL